MLENCGTKSNSRIAASLVEKPESAERLLSPGRPKSVVFRRIPLELSKHVFGPSTPRLHAGSPDTVWTFPVPRTIPDANPMIPVPPLKLPAARGSPVYVTFEIVTPLPTNIFARAAAVAPWFMSLIDRAASASPTVAAQSANVATASIPSGAHDRKCRCCCVNRCGRTATQPIMHSSLENHAHVIMK